MSELGLGNISFDQMVSDADSDTTTATPAPGPEVEVDQEEENLNQNNEQEQETPNDSEEQEVEETTEESEEQDENQEEDNEEEQAEPSLVQEFQERLGYDELGDFEDSMDGLLEMTRAASDKLAEDTLDGVFNQFPHVQQFMEFRRNGGDPTDFFNTMYPQNNYGEMEVEADNTAQHRQLVKESLAKQGFEQEEIQEQLSDFESAGILQNQANIALKNLQRVQKKEQQELIQKQEDQAQALQEQQEEFWGNVKETLNKTSEIGGVVIPESQKDDFFKFVSEPADNQGNSQRNLAAKEFGMQEHLLIDYLVYQISQNGIDGLGGIIDRKASTKNAQSLRERLKNNGGQDPSDKTPTPSGGSDDVSVPSLDNMGF